MFENIEVSIDQRLGIITINRPKVRNALSQDTLNDIVSALEELSINNEVGCVVFTGKGDKSFAAGADIKQLREKTTLDALNPRGMQYVYNLIENYEKPTIAAVNGYALGGGCELAMVCDIRIASSNAKFGLPELNLSIIPSAGGTQRLARLVGKGKALEMILTGKIMDAHEALRFGLVSEVVETDQLLNKVKEYGKKILSKGPLAVKLAKIAVNQGSETDLQTGLLLEKLSQAILFGSEDKNEGTQAFIEKRELIFKGK